MNKQTIDLDVITGGVPQVLHVAQYDTGARTLEFNIYSSNNDLDLTGATAKISGRKADGLGFEYPATITDGVVVADCTDQMTAVAGIVECAITLTDSEGQIQTARFDLNVKPAPLNDDTVISDSDFPLIQQAIGAEEDAEAWAVGTRNGEPVPVSDPTYENNAKYWAEQAEQTDIGQVNEEIADIVNVYGSKNLIPYPYYEDTETDRGITYTNNNDGTVTVGSGTAQNGTNHVLVNNIQGISIPKGKYILSSGNTADPYVYVRLQLYLNGSAGVSFSTNNSAGEVSFDITNATYDSIQIQIFVSANHTVENPITIKPMLRLASIEDDTYVPYVPTNAKLDEEKVSYSDASESVQKNLLSYPYYETTKTSNGITFTDLGDGTIKANGTATANAVLNCHTRAIGTAIPLFVPNGRYIISGCPSGGSQTTYLIGVAITKNGSASTLANDYGYGEEFIINGDDTYTDKVQLQIQIAIKSGATVNNLIFKPMLRKATIKDDTWQPYIPDNTELTTWKANGVLGAKNLIPCTASTTVKTGITFTVNDDKTITVNGTNTGSTANVFDIGDFTLKAGTYYFSGTPSGAYTSGVGARLQLINVSTSAAIALNESPEDTRVVIASDIQARLRIWYSVSATLNNVTFKPMLRLAEDTDDTYQPYAMTNRELTELTQATINRYIKNDAAVNIETQLATYPQNNCWSALIAHNSNTGDLVTLSGGHLFIIKHIGFPSPINAKCEQAFDCTTGKIYTRTYKWWSSEWTAWQAS